MTLVDTSVWIDYFAGRPLPHVAALVELIEARDDLALCGLVLTEVLQGIRTDDDYDRVLTHFRTLTLLPMEHSIFVLGADIYRKLRRRGTTIRRTNDCLIAAVALSYEIALLHADADFDRIARTYPLRGSR